MEWYSILFNYLRYCWIFEFLFQHKHRKLKRLPPTTIHGIDRILLGHNFFYSDFSLLKKTYITLPNRVILIFWQCMAGWPSLFNVCLLLSITVHIWWILPVRIITKSGIRPDIKIIIGYPAKRISVLIVNGYPAQPY